MKSSRKSTDLTANTPYYSRPIRRIQDFDELKDHCLTLKNTPYPHQRYVIYNTLVNEEKPTGFTSIRRIHQEDTAYSCLHFTRNHKDTKSNTQLEEEKARRRGQVYNWETVTYGKIWCNEDVYDLRSIETEFPAIVLNDALTSEVTLSCEPTVSPLNDNQIDFRISFDESDDEDYTEIFNKGSLSYKIICVDDLKTDSENDNDKINMPSFPSPKPTVIYFNDLDFFKDFEKEFPAIVYNDALTSKLNFVTEPTISPQHIDEFNLKNKTSLSECDEEEQNVLYFNGLFPFNVIDPDNSKLDKDNDDDKIDIKQSSGEYKGAKKSKTSETTSGSASGGFKLNDEADEYEEAREHRPLGCDDAKAKKKSTTSLIEG
ncbi:hypothetical protein Tco_0762756 [Tanacetum coccineum]